MCLIYHNEGPLYHREAIWIRGRLFPLDNSAFFLAPYTVLAIDVNKYNTEDSGGKRVER